MQANLTMRYLQNKEAKYSTVVPQIWLLFCASANLFKAIPVINTRDSRGVK